MKKIGMLSILICVCSISGIGQVRDMGIENRVVSVRFDRQPLATVIRHLIERYDVAFGFEESLLDRDHNDFDFETNLPSTVRTTIQADNARVVIEAEREFISKKHRITIDLDNQKLGRVLDIVVKQMRNYRWEINDGVVNIVPNRGRDPKFETLLTTGVRDFRLGENNDVGEITTQLLLLPEIRTFLQQNRLFWNGHRVGSEIRLTAQLGRKLNRTLEYSNLSFRELLNRITLVKRGGWILKKSDTYGSKDREFIDIDI